MHWCTKIAIYLSAFISNECILITNRFLNARKYINHFIPSTANKRNALHAHASIGAKFKSESFSFLFICRAAEHNRYRCTCWKTLHNGVLRTTCSVGTYLMLTFRKFRGHGPVFTRPGNSRWLYRSSRQVVPHWTEFRSGIGAVVLMWKMVKWTLPYKCG